MEGKEVPVNTSESAAGLLERPFSDHVQNWQTYIPSQPPAHMGLPKIVSEIALEDVMGGKAQEVLRQFRETPERQPLLKDEKFQYWLKQVGVLQTYSESSEEMQALRNFAIKIGMKKKITQTEQLFLMMMSRKGRFSSADRYTEALEGDRWDLENPEEGGEIVVARQKYILQQKLKDERGDLRLGATICNIRSLGLGIGIRNFGLDHQEVSVLYHLYLNKGKLIPSSVLTSVLSRGKEKEMVNPINNLQVYIRKIRKKAAKLGYLFEIKTEWGLGNMLIEKKLTEELHAAPEGYSSSEKEFSAWLGQQIEEISAAEDVLLKSQVSPEGQSSSQKEFQDWLGQMNVLQTQRDPGGRNFALSPQEKSLLYYLYLTRGRWVSADRLFSALPREGKKMEVADLDNYISTYIKNIRKKAAERGYLFEIETERNLGYRLVEKQERTVA